VLLLPICHDLQGNVVLSSRQRCLAPELVRAWEEETIKGDKDKLAAMAAFRQAVLASGLLTEAFDNKPSFFRYLQARKWNVADALKMFTDNMAWRDEMGLNDWIATPRGAVPRFLLEFSFPEMQPTKQAYNFVHHKMDKNGRPVYFDRMGAMEYGSMMKSSTPDRVLKYFIWYSEASIHYRFSQASIECGRFIGKGLYVVDLTGFALTKHFTKDTREFIKSFVSMASNNYPESIYKTYVINAPFVFRTVWAFVSAMLDDNAKAKFSIMGGKREYLPKLLEVLDPKDIPSAIGGEDTTCDFVEEKGPWAQEMPTPAGPYLSVERPDEPWAKLINPQP